ncbi:MAG: oxidoreductase [Planctomycetia bacterium]|nr:MAG: isomerase [Planctomycetes bacterium UTPLA1]
MNLRFFQVDAFASRLFAGNPAGVVPLDAWLTDDTLQNIAMESNLAETAFIVPEAAGQSDFHLRWFTPAVEMDLCGHATLATAHVLKTELGFTADRIRFRSKSGVLTVTTEEDRLVLDFPSRSGEPIDVFSELTAALGARPISAIRSRDLMAVFETAEQVRALVPDMVRVAALDAFAVIVTAPGSDCDFVSRFFAPKAGVPEDPVTGSAHCTLIPYWAQRLGKREMLARQISARGGELHCRAAGDRVHIGGQCVTYLQGIIRLSQL